MMDLDSGEAKKVRQLSLLEVDPEKTLLRKRHLFKTGALIAAAAVGPSYLAKAEIQEMASQPLLRFSQRVGLLFQITDDILDVTSSASELGKEPAADKRQGTSTYVSLYGLDGAKALAQTTAEEAHEALTPFGAKAKDLRSLIDWVRDREK
jgi:farnesyl diphosphate synthase